MGQLIDSAGSEVTVVEQTEIIEYTVEFPMCYSTLTDTQKRMYRIMLTAADKMIVGFFNLGRTGKDYANDVAMAYRAIMCDHPEFFWLPTNYVISKRGSESNPEALAAFSYESSDASYDYIVSREKRDRMQSELDDAVASYISGLNDINSTFEQELYIHDRLCNETEYFDCEDPLIYTSYGALVQKKAVCEGYSRAMQLLCSELGIPCLLVYGDSENEGHMWNLINPGDGWYHLDVTWDDTNELCHTYFNMTDSEISANHTIYDTYADFSGDISKVNTCYNFFSFPCQSTLFNYFSYTNSVLEPDFKKASLSVYINSSKGMKSAEMRIDDAALLAEFKSDFNEPISRLQQRLVRDYGKNAPQINAISQTEKYVTLFWE